MPSQGERGAQSKSRPTTSVIVLAGGEGRRLFPLTRRRCKPAIPFAGRYRLIDFVLSSLVHSNLTRIHVLTQYESYSLIRHLSRGWGFSAQMGQYCEVIPPTPGRGWYLGSADALYQNLERIGRDRPGIVAVFGADHIYRMDIQQMIREHVESEADISISVVPQPIGEAHQFGCLEVDQSMRVRRFLEKPEDPPPFPEDPQTALVSMGNYLFNYDVLCRCVEEDHDLTDSRHDIGGDVFPRWYERAHIHAYNFLHNRIPGAAPSDRGYWRDVGTLSSYWRSSMDLVSVTPAFNMYNYEWPILTARADNPPAKFVFAERESNRMGIATDSLVGDGSIISGGHIDRCVLGPRVRINSYASVSESILFEGVDVGRSCRIRRAIIDKHVRVPPDTAIGYDAEHDRARGLHVSEDGIVVVPPEAEFGTA
ncbi:MAG TPA: glucose-1-phosphate adenylyltransferase [Candidatus Polarisedimenticolia bacterium]|nr:glucose-1-phosphate adenylyltransferase [Candidatus Polarisedimenticolia bacterium]